MAFSLASFDIKKLFVNPDMFDSPDHWRTTGFDVEGKGVMSGIMVASHPSARGCLFKKYSKKIPLKEQLENYRCRVKGADKLREFIAAQQLTRIVVPRKQLHELPPEFSREGVPSFVLVVERLVLLNSAEAKRMYRQLDNEGLRQLCATLLAFRGLDSYVGNAPFTDKGQIAFIDTELWNREKRVPLRRIREGARGGAAGGAPGVAVDRDRGRVMGLWNWLKNSQRPRGSAGKARRA